MGGADVAPSDALIIRSKIKLVFDEPRWVSRDHIYGCESAPGSQGFGSTKSPFHCKSSIRNSAGSKSPRLASSISKPISRFIGLKLTLSAKPAMKSKLSGESFRVLSLLDFSIAAVMTPRTCLAHGQVWDMPSMASRT